MSMVLAGDVIRYGDVPALSSMETIVRLLELRQHYERAKLTAECHLHEDEACVAPRTRDECEWAPTRFCAARLREETVYGRKLEEESRIRRRQEVAEQCGIPRIMWPLLGVRPSDGGAMEARQASTFVRYVQKDRRKKIVVLSGPDGVGKSTAAALWCWMVHGWYYRATNLRWFTRGGGWNASPMDTRLLQDGAVAIVGLDRPWASRDGAHRHSLIHILYERLDRGKLTLLTTNLGKKELTDSIGSSLMLSIGRWSGLATITTGGPDSQAQEEDDSDPPF